MVIQLITFSGLFGFFFLIDILKLTQLKEKNQEISKHHNLVANLQYQANSLFIFLKVFKYRVVTFWLEYFHIFIPAIVPNSS